LSLCYKSEVANAPSGDKPFAGQSASGGLARTFQTGGDMIHAWMLAPLIAFVPALGILSDKVVFQRLKNRRRT